MNDRPLELLQAIAGPDAGYRSGQREATLLLPDGVPVLYTTATLATA